MWSLPTLPTDNLYKLILFVGMAMFVAAAYLTSLGDRPFEESGRYVYSRAVILRDRLEDAGAKPKPVENDLSEENPYDRYNEYRDLIRSVSLDPAQAQQLRDMNEHLLNIRLLNRRTGERIERNSFTVRILLVIGSILTTCGGAAWYFSFQRHQDYIAKLNALEAYQR